MSKKLIHVAFVLFSVAAFFFCLAFLLWTLQQKSPSPIPVYTLADGLYNVRSYVIDNETGSPVPDGLSWDYAVLINPRISGEFAEIPRELLSKKSDSQRSHFFFLDALKKASRVYKVKKEEEEKIRITNGFEVKKSPNYLNIQYKFGNSFYLIEPGIESSGGDVYIPESLINEESAEKWENQKYFFYRHQLELISW